MLIPAHKQSRDWTVLYYGGGVNNLDQDIREAWAGLADEKRPANVDTFVRHIDQHGQSQDIHIGPEQEKRILCSDSGPVDSSDPDTLTEFIRKGVSNYPAKHYLVVLSSHGRGAEGVLEDDLQNSIMRPHELRAALEAGKQANRGRPLDAVLFDACRMAAVEMASELVGSTLITVASMDSIADAGYDLGDALEAASKSEDALELGRRLVHNDSNRQLDTLNSISAVDLSKIPDLETSWAKFTEQIQKVDKEGLELLALHARDSRRNRPSPLAEYGNDLLADSILGTPNDNNKTALELWLLNQAPGDAVAIVSFCNRILSDQGLLERFPGLGDAAVGVVESHDATVFAYRTQDRLEDPGGLTVSLPLKNQVGPLYDSPLNFARTTGWESGYNAVLPDGEQIPIEKSWLEREIERPHRPPVS